MLRIAVQMDPIEKTYPGETTHYIAREAHRRGHELYFYTPAELSFRTPAVMATVRRMTYSPELPVVDHLPRRGVGVGVELGAPSLVDLQSMDVVLLRQDPPFDLRYLTTTYLLERLAPRTLVVNDPRAVRDISEKLSLLHFSQLAPPTLVTSDPDQVRAFLREHGELVLKPLYGKSGDGMFLLTADDKNANVILETMLAPGNPPVMAQQFIHGTSKKVVIVDGTICGALLVEPEPDDVRGNLDRGRAVRRADLTAAERATVEPIAAFLRERGVLFAGIDLIGRYLLENNVTSPGALFYFNPLFEVKLEQAIVDAIESAVRVAPRCDSKPVSSSPSPMTS